MAISLPKTNCSSYSADKVKRKSSKIQKYYSK